MARAGGEWHHFARLKVSRALGGDLQNAVVPRCRFILKIRNEKTKVVVRWLTTGSSGAGGCGVLCTGLQGQLGSAAASRSSVWIVGPERLHFCTIVSVSSHSAAFSPFAALSLFCSCVGVFRFVKVPPPAASKLAFRCRRQKENCLSTYAYRNL